jgi:predicted DNA-binding transcriptional regulator YafY
VTTGERRSEIIRILTARRRETMRNLARELGVTPRTIRTDILVLTADYPLETRRGNGGCVKVAEWFHPHRNILTAEQQRVLSQMIAIGDERQAKVLRELLVEYGSPKSRRTLREENHVGSTFEQAHSGRARPAPDGISTP